MTTDDKLEVNGSQSVPSALSNPEAVAGATNGSASLPGPRVLRAAEALPEEAGPATGRPTASAVRPVRTCSECGGALPQQSRPERATCSPRCAQLRHSRLRKSRVDPQVRVSERATVAAPLEVEAVSVVPGPPETTSDGPMPPSGGTLLDAVVHLSTLLPAGWSAEIGPGSITLSWRNCYIGAPPS